MPLIQVAAFVLALGTNLPAEIAVAADAKKAKSASRPGFPAEYSLGRPLLRDKPDALLAGDDWQGMTDTSDLKDYRIYINKWNSGASGRAADASTVDVPSTPGAKRAEIVDDPTFGKAVRLWQTDHSDGDSQAVFLQRRWPGVSKCWVRILIKYQKGFTTGGPGGSANSWKLIVGPESRSMTWTNTTQMLFQGTANDVLKKAPQNTLEADWHRLFGFEETGGSDVPTDLCNHLEMGINRNKPLHKGRVQWWMWGPWEVVDGNVIPDPYGIEHMIK